MKRATWAQHKIRLVLLLLLSNLLACTPMIHPSKAPVALAQLSNNFFITPDGAKLPLKKWQSPHQEIKNIIIAIHGFNDYSNFFQQPGHYFSQHQTTSYAYDQRGFGKSPNRGLWAGIETYTADLACFVQLISQEHPKTPIYLLGESMGLPWSFPLSLKPINFPLKALSWSLLQSGDDKLCPGIKTYSCGLCPISLPG